MRTPTKAQRKVLEEMARGGVVETNIRTGVSKLGDASVRSSTLAVLVDRGWVDPCRYSYKHEHRIADLGRRVLAAAALSTPDAGEEQP